MDNIYSRKYFKESECPTKTLSGLRNASKVDWYKTDSGQRNPCTSRNQKRQLQEYGGHKLGYNAEGEFLVATSLEF